MQSEESSTQQPSPDGDRIENLPQISADDARAREGDAEPRSEKRMGPDESTSAGASSTVSSGESSAVGAGAVIDEPSSEKQTGGDKSREEKFDPKRRALEHECYQLYVVRRKSKSAIARELHLDRDTVAKYIDAEAERRRPEFEAARATEIQKSIEIYESVANKYLDRMEEPTAKGDEGRYVIQARERIDALLGLDEPKKIKDETPGAGATRAILVGLGPAERTALMRQVIERRASAKAAK